jgi:predicted nucleic-acid-binding Zn-ribbon protein
MSNTKCPRCGGQEFHEIEQHSYVDSEALSEENKNTYKRQLTCLKCNFEFMPSSTYR